MRSQKRILVSCTASITISLEDGLITTYKWIEGELKKAGRLEHLNTADHKCSHT